MVTADVHEHLADLALSGASDRVADLGAGRGRTLAVLARRAPAAQLTAVDVSREALAVVAADLPQVRRITHDLSGPLPFDGGQFDVVVSHNVLECLTDPTRLLSEIDRVLRPGGRAILGHTDFETIVVVAADRDLSRRVLLTYAELPVSYRNMAATDGQMGRHLPGVVRRSPLRLESIQPHTTVIPSLAEARAARLDEVAAAARRCAERGLGYVAVAEVDAWLRQLQDAEDSGDFVFSETNFLITATTSG